MSPALICNALLICNSAIGPRINPIIKGVIGTPKRRNANPTTPTPRAIHKSKIA